jgi:hypothetical protein
MCEGAIIQTGHPHTVQQHYRSRCQPCDFLLSRQGSDKPSADGASEGGQA